MDTSLFRYTLIFLRRLDQILMLHRRNPPNQGLWNGLGGRIEPGETPLACALREVREESGFELETLEFGGLLTWDGFETPPGGLYLFRGDAPEGEERGNGEGELEWKDLSWVLSDKGVVSNIHIFGPGFFRGAAPREYRFHYQDGEILSYEFLELG
jgi:8-oxo-dGTP diphosphatase